MKKLKKAYVVELNRNKQAQKFLNERGVCDASIQDFGIGFSSSHIKNNLDEETQKLLSSLEIFNENGNDRNWRRLIFPIHNEDGELLGFNGRKIEDVGESPKYLLPSDSTILSKSDILFNLHQAKEHIKKEGHVVLAEGVFDVLALHQAGIKNAVCVLGSSIDEKQLEMLMKYTDKFVLAYDGDLAGFKAHINTTKLINHVLHKLQKTKIDLKAHVKHIVFKDGVDAGDYLKKSDELYKLFNRRLNGVDFTFNKIKEDVKFGEAFQKIKNQNLTQPSKQKSPITKQVLEQIDIVDVVSHYSDLRKQGKNYVTKCLAPDHNEKTGSMVISSEKQIFKCFGCGCGGTAISFIQMMEDVSYNEALVILKERHGLVINPEKINNKTPVVNPKEAKILSQKQKQELLEFTISATQYTLQNTNQGKVAQKILMELGITSDMLADHQIGLALKDKTLLAKQIDQNNMTTIALEMGLIVKNNDRLESSLVGVIKPFRTEEGHIVGFETFSSKNIHELADNILTAEKKKELKKEAMAL